MKNPNVLSNSLHIYNQEYHMVYRNTHFCDYLVYLSEQFHMCNSNLSHYIYRVWICPCALWKGFLHANVKLPLICNEDVFIRKNCTCILSLWQNVSCTEWVFPCLIFIAPCVRLYQKWKLMLGNWKCCNYHNTPHLWRVGCNRFDIVCVSVCVSVCACYHSHGKTDRQTDLNFGI